MEGPPTADSVPDAGIDRGVGPVPRNSAPPRVVERRASSGLFEWFWRGRAIAAVRARAGSGTRERELERRARVAAHLAAHAFEPRERFPDGDATFLACALYRESVSWAVRALAGDESLATPDVRALWSAIEPSVLRRVAPDDAAVEALRRSYVETSSADFAELAVDEQARNVERLRALSTALLQQLDVTQRLVDGLWLQRLLRCGLVLLVLLVAGLGYLVADRYGPDFARGKTWRASSDFQTGGCKSPEQRCDDSPYYFFHTRVEPNPWVEIDLGGPKTFTRLRIDNREDCCYERAVPLVVEVSDDAKRWKQVAWRKQAFTRWNVDLPPTSARFVRIRVKGEGPLHLKGVRVQP
jgi:hypothetical protein